MKIVKPSVELIWMTSNPLQVIEKCGRIAYKSEDKITESSAESFVKMILKNGHESVIEHASMSYKVICDRGVSHEIVRHRLFSYTQESTRYCNYGKGDIQFIMPPYETHDTFDNGHVPNNILKALIQCEDSYKYFIEIGEKPQIARSVLPSCLKTEIAITGNFREWRYFFKMRTAKNAHPQMQQIAKMILNDAKSRVNLIFEEYNLI
jgi:thymidylate synthase (FAD)